MIPPGGNRDVKDVRVVERIRLLLDALSERGSCSLKEMSAAAGLATSTSLRLLESLENHGFVERQSATKRYGLGPTLFRLTAGSKLRQDLIAVVHPVLEWLVAETREDAGLAELRGTHAVIIDQVEGPHPLKIIDVLGKPEPLNCGAFRKVLLAYQDENWIRSYISSTRFERFTNRTITRRGALLRELENIRKQGFALSYGERLEEAGGVAAPVFDFDGRLRAAIQVVTPLIRMTPASTRLYVAAVVRAANTATARLGGSRARIVATPGSRAGHRHQQSKRSM